MRKGSAIDRLGCYHVGVKATSRTLIIAYLAQLNRGAGVLVTYDDLR